MDISRLKKNDLKAWLTLMEGVEVLCRHLSQKEFDRINAAATSIKFDSRSHQNIQQRDEAKFRRDLALAVVEDWRGLVDGANPYPCTPDNIVFMMEESTEFRLLVMDAPLSFEKMLAAERAAVEKNSETTSAPAPTSQG